MLRVRKLVLAVAAATALTSGVAHALGLGNVSVKSSLNQPLEAEIELLEVGGLTALEIKSQLASSEEFSRAGVERQFFLTNLKFTPIISASGRSVVRVTSERSVREPYLNFLVELLWPNGRVLREYTLLLDPPMYTPQEIVYQPATTAPKAVKQPAPARKATPASPRRVTASGDNQYRVERNDTLWSIASRVGGSTTTQQTMLAIRDLNPQAFVNGDINRLKAGQVLTLPDDAQIQKRSKSAAIAEVKAQISTQTASAPEAAASVKQLDARHRTTADAAPAKVEQQDTLRLVASDTGQAAIGSERGQDSSAALLAQLTEAKETLDSSLRENTDLQDRVAELNSQLDKLQQLIELKNTQLASLQHLDALTEQQQVTEEPEVVEAADVAEEQFVETASDAEPTIEQPTETTLVAEPTVEPAVEAEPVVEQVTEKPAVDAPKPQAVVPPLQEIPSPEQSLIDELMENPLFMPAVGGGSLLLLLLLLMSASRRKKKAKELSLAAASASADKPEADDLISSFTADTDEELPVAEPLSDFADFDTVKTTQGAGLEVSAESVNAIAEADNYIAYGRFNQAADVLMQAIDKKPQRADLRFKLLEVLADLEDKNGFTRQLNELVEMGVAPGEIEAVKSRYPHLVENGTSTISHVEDSEISLDDLELDSPEFNIDTFAEPKFDEQSVNELSDDLFDELNDDLVSEEAGQVEKALFDLDELSLTLNDAPDVKEPAAEQPLETPEFELPDFDELDAELLASTEPQDTEAPNVTENLVGDLVDADELVAEDFDFDTLTEIEDAEFAEVVKEVQDETKLDFELPDDFDLSVIEEPASDLEDGLSLETTDLSSDFNEISAEMDDLAETLKDSMEVDELLDAELDSLDIDFTSAQPEALADEKTEQDISLDTLDDLELPSESLDDFDFGDLEETLNFEEPADFTAELDLEAAPELDSNLMDELAKLSELSEEPEVELGEQPATGTTFAALEEALEDDFSFLAGTDETTTKLDLARAYVDMGDSEGAKDILEEVLSEGNDEQQQEARELMKKLS
ncbi:MAG: LysM peptidoglycan-binding domain-containing protein [Thiopseudomonas sp.]|nr:LysM peptidoglycan-binding domain-containing protein [Thiopseudomonas sp.]MCK9465233.1 LysM peptidoglycan-binding domain-containing protein [Thiopseudomonas sp.]